MSVKKRGTRWAATLGPAGWRNPQYRQAGGKFQARVQPVPIQLSRPYY
jgi:hypothetical protein